MWWVTHLQPGLLLHTRPSPLGKNGNSMYHHISMVIPPVSSSEISSKGLDGCWWFVSQIKNTLKQERKAGAANKLEPSSSRNTDQMWVNSAAFCNGSSKRILKWGSLLTTEQAWCFWCWEHKGCAIMWWKTGDSHENVFDLYLKPLLRWGPFAFLSQVKPEGKCH